MLVYFTHGLFLTCTQKYYIYIYRIRNMILTHIQRFSTRKKTLPHERPRIMYLLGEPASFLVVTNSHPPLSLVCQQLPHPLAFTIFTPFSPHIHISLFTSTTLTISVIFVRDKSNIHGQWYRTEPDIGTSDLICPPMKVSTFNTSILPARSHDWHFFRQVETLSACLKYKQPFFLL